jgi:hypothetical protein
MVNTLPADDIGHTMHSAVCTAIGASEEYKDRAISVASGSRPSTVQTRSRGTRGGSPEGGDHFPFAAGTSLNGPNVISPTLGEAYARDINGGLSPEIQRVGQAVVGDPATATGTHSYRGADRARAPESSIPTHQPPTDEDWDWSVQGQSARGKKHKPPPDHDADWALPRIIAPKGSAFGQRPLGGGARRPAPPSGVPAHIATKQGPGVAGARVQGGDAVFGVLAVKRAATAPNWMAGRHGAPATVHASPRTGTPRMAPHASWEAIVGPVADWIREGENTVTDFVEERSKDPASTGRRISTSERIRRGQVPLSSPHGTSRGRTPRAGHRTSDRVGDRGMRGSTDSTAGRSATTQAAQVVRPRTTPAGVGRRRQDSPMGIVAAPRGFVSHRPVTSGTVASIDLRLPMTDRGPMARQVRLSSSGGGSVWKRKLGSAGSSVGSGLNSPRARNAYSALGNSWAAGGESARLDMGGELIARPPRHSDMDKPPAGLWGHDAIPSDAILSDRAASKVMIQPSSARPSKVTRPDGAGDWAELARDYDQEFPTDPAGWHFGHAFQDLQAVQHKHMLTAPAAGPGFFYSTARTAATPGAANPVAFQEEIRPSTAPYIPPGSAERPSTAPVTAATGSAAAAIARRESPTAVGSTGGTWALDEMDSSHHFGYEPTASNQNAPGPRTPSPPERQPSPPGPELAATATRPTSVRGLRKPASGSLLRVAGDGLASPTMSVSMMEKRLRAGVAPALQRRIVD